MSEKTGKFTILFADGSAPRTIEKDGIFIGRLKGDCDVFLDHKAVSRIHAGINYRDSDYHLVNLSTSNILTLNGRLVGPQKGDVLADGDIIQIGPFTIGAAIERGAISLTVQRAVADKIPEQPAETQPLIPKMPAERGIAESSGVLKLFWKKRSRDDKEDWGSHLRPTEAPIPGKAMFNWRPTRDLRRPWRVCLFVCAFLAFCAIGAFSYFRYPQTYEPKPLSNPHAAKIEGSTVAAMPNGNSCTTRHTLNQPIENSCVKCHTAQEFHTLNPKGYEE